MKLIDAIFNVDRPKSATAWQYVAPIEEISQELCAFPLYNCPTELDERFKEYPIFDWVCTDETVGLFALYLDDEPVGAYYRECRKCSYRFMWLSTECADRVRQVIESYREGQVIILVDPEELITDNGRYYRGDGPSRLKVSA